MTQPRLRTALLGLLAGALLAAPAAAQDRQPRIEPLPEGSVADLVARFARAEGPFEPEYAATIELCGPCVHISVQLMGISHLTEYRRRLLAANNTHRLELDLDVDTGGAARTNVYRTRDRRLLLLSPHDCVWLTPEPLDAKLCSQGELPLRKGLKWGSCDPEGKGWTRRRRPKTWEPLRESDYYDGLFYVGTFDHVRGEIHDDFRLNRGWRFISADEGPEEVSECWG